MNLGRTSLTRKGGKDDKNHKGILQVANEKAEAERKAREEEKEEEKKEIMELRQATVALRREMEAYESMYGQSELGYLRDEDSVRSNSLRRAMAGSSETSQELVAEVRAREMAQAQQTNTRGTQEHAMPPVSWSIACRVQCGVSP